MKWFVHLIGYSLLSVVIPIQTSFCSSVRLQIPEVVLGKLLDIGWVTLGHTTPLPIHHKIIATLQGRHILQNELFIAINIFGSPHHISSYGHGRSKMPKMMLSIYGIHGR